MFLKLSSLVINLIFVPIGWLSSAYSIWQTFLKDALSQYYGFFNVIVWLIVLLYIGFEINSYISLRRKKITHSSAVKVHEYLYKWIETGGRTLIFTRDFTWAKSSPQMYSLLEKKAKNKELIICLLQKNEATEALEKCGAEVYQHNVTSLKSRFTIVNYGTVSPRITVGSRDVNGNYINEQCNIKSNPYMYNLFVELFESTKASAINNKATTLEEEKEPALSGV